jgi:hypothetical protein
MVKVKFVQNVNLDIGLIERIIDVLSLCFIVKIIQILMVFAKDVFQGITFLIKFAQK